MKTPGLAVICFFVLHAHGFGILPGVSLSHQEITEQAILNATLQTCRDLAQAEGTDFSFPVWLIHFTETLWLVAYC